MNIFSTTIVSNALASLVAGGLIFGAGYAIDSNLEKLGRQKYSVPAGTAEVAISTPVPPKSSAAPVANKPQVKKAQAVTPVDPIVDCQFPHSGPIKMAESKCKQMTDCEIEPGKWSAVYLSDCEALRAKEKRVAGIQSPSTPTAQPTSTPRSKVQFTTTEAIVDGTYWCYEDRVNELTRIENNIKAKTLSADICSDNAQLGWEGCVSDSCQGLGSEEYSSCLQECRSKHNCLDKHTEVGNLRREYEKRIAEICP